MEFEKHYKKTTREVQACPPCPTNNNESAAGFAVGCGVMVLALIGLLFLIKLFL